MDTRFPSRGLMLFAAISLAACAGGKDEEGAAAAAADTAKAVMPVMHGVEETSGTSGTAGMPGMGGGGMMVEEMTAHMRKMDGAGADSLKAMIPGHRQMMANMISQFDRDMRGMTMTDGGWQATVDSLRRDNVQMPEMSAGELRSFLPAHSARVTRLMEMHRSMMANMEKN